MLAIDFKAPVEVTITFEDSDEDLQDIKKEINTDDCSNNVNKENVTDEVIQENVPKQDNSKNIENHTVNKDFRKTNNTIETENIISRKRKLSTHADETIPTTDENSVKHTVITTSHGQTHIIVTPQTNTSPPSNDKSNKYLDNLLKAISEHLLIIMEAYEKLTKEDYVKLKNQYFTISYSTVDSIIVPQENDMLFVTRFLKDTLKLSKERNTIPIQNEQQIFPFYYEMLEWTKEKHKTLQEMQPKNFLNFKSCKETVQPNVSLRSARPNKQSQSISQSNRNTSDISNAQIVALLQRQNPGQNANIKNNAMSNETNILNTNVSLNGQAKITGNRQMYPSSVVPSTSRSIVSPLNNIVTNAIPSQLPNFMNLNNLNLPTSPSGQSQYQHIQQGMYQPTQSGLSQMARNGLLFNQQQQSPHWTGSDLVQNAYQQSQHSLSTVNRISQNHIQQSMNPGSSRGISSYTVPKIQNVSGNTQQAQINQSSKNINTDFLTAQAWHVAQGIGLNQPFNGKGHVPMANPSYQNNSYAQNTEWASNRQPPPYDAAYFWKGQGSKSSNKEQQQQQHQQTQRRMSATRQHQVEPQQPEVVRSMSTDSGIVSPLPFVNPTDATSYSHLPEEDQQAPFITHVTSLNPKVSYINDGKCAVCCKITNLKCLCFKKYYCSYDCQKYDWNSHKIVCSAQQDHSSHA